MGISTLRWKASDIPDQRGRAAVITGANSGLGRETARRLAGCGARVTMAVRNQEKARAARAQILSEFPGSEIEIVGVDLADQASVRSAAELIAARHRSLDLLVNNAGVMGSAESVTVDGYEHQLGVDHLGHWTLTALLMPSLLRAPHARVVTVTSMARLLGRRIDPANPHMRGCYGTWRAYGQAKLANYHFGIGLQRQFDEAGSRCASLLAHPGAARTDLTAASVTASDGGVSQRVLQRATAAIGMSAAEGALPQLRAATDPMARGGQFYGPMLIARGAPVSRTVVQHSGLSRSIDVLWQVSERETGVRIDLRPNSR